MTSARVYPTFSKQPNFLIKLKGLDPELVPLFKEEAYELRSMYEHLKYCPKIEGPINPLDCSECTTRECEHDE